MITQQALDVVDSVYSCVEAECVQVGSGLFTFKDVSRGFYNLAALFAVSGLEVNPTQALKRLSMRGNFLLIIIVWL